MNLVLPIYLLIYYSPLFVVSQIFLLESFFHVDKFFILYSTSMKAIRKYALCFVCLTGLYCPHTVIIQFGSIHTVLCWWLFSLNSQRNIISSHFIGSWFWDVCLWFSVVSQHCVYFFLYLLLCIAVVSYIQGFMAFIRSGKL